MGGLWTTVADMAKWITWLDSANSRPDQADPIGLSTASRREMQRMHTYVGVTDVAGHRSPTGYGFGLNLRDDATLGTLVAHSGGLPGYGSNMRWIAGRGLGLIALANTTYAPMAELTLRMFDVLHEHGVVPPAAPPEAPLLQAAATRLVDLLNDWAESRATALFADNMALDESLSRRRAAAHRVQAVHGRLTLGAVTPECATSGTVALHGTLSDATLHLRIELSPEPTAGVQFYELAP